MFATCYPASGSPRPRAAAPPCVKTRSGSPASSTRSSYSFAESCTTVAGDADDARGQVDPRSQRQAGRAAGRTPAAALPASARATPRRGTASRRSRPLRARTPARGRRDRRGRSTMITGTSRFQAWPGSPERSRPQSSKPDESGSTASRRTRSGRCASTSSSAFRCMIGREHLEAVVRQLLRQKLPARLLVLDDQNCLPRHGAEASTQL